MADPTISGTFPESGDQFQFNVNGLATQKQMEKLLQLTEAMAKRIKADIDTGKKQNKEDKEHYENTKDLNEQQKEQLKKNKELQAAWDDLVGITKKLKYGWKDSAKEIGGWTTELTFATSFLVGSLTGYADSISGALKMGVSGEIMDFAVAAKTAGVSMGTLTKALSDTGGGFASLGQGATDGAKNFAALVSSVRSATASVGNLGMTNEEMAMFTAQQTKLAVSQGFKGKAAQDVVIKNSQYLGKELDDLANRTGKSVLAMAEAAAKLASDPIVTTFVKTAQAGSEQVSKAIQSFGASLNAQFGDIGGQLGADVLKSALGGLPFAITQTGKNMLLASQTTYNELERQAQKAKRGEEITAEDRKKLNDTVLKEVAARGDQLRMMANLEGPAGESARQLLSMAKEAEFYNSEAGRQRREQDKAAQQFNASIRQLQANLQALAIPLLNLINGVNWTVFIDILNGFTVALGLVLKPLSWLGNLIGDSGAGTVVGALLGLMGIVSFATTGFTLLKTTLSTVTDYLSKFGTALQSNAEKPRYKLVDGKPVKAEPYNAGYKVGEFVSKFKTEIIAATAAVAGLGIASIGTSMLEEDANSTMGAILKYGGTFVEVIGTWIPLLSGLVAIFPALGVGLAGLATAVGGTLIAIAPVVAVLAAVAGAGWLLYKGLGLAADGLSLLWDAVKETGSAIFELGSKIFDAISAPFKWLGDWFKNSWIGKLFGNDTTSARGNIGSYNKASGPIYQGALGNNPGAILTSSADNKSMTAVSVDQNTTGYSKELVNTQSNAIDQNKVKDAETANLQKKQVALLEEISGTNNAQLGVQARTASAQDNSNRYLKTLSLTGNP
jgi:hypothetical protein